MINLNKLQLLRLNKNKIKNKRIIVRVDYNIELKNKKFEDRYRIEKSLPTIKFLLTHQAKQIILITHLGRPKNNKDKNLSTKKILPLLKKYFKEVNYYYWQPGKPISNHQLIILENIRFFKEEENNDEKFAYQLSKIGDIFVNEAFSVSHRRHSSVYQLQKFLPTLYGFNFENEIKNLNKAFKIKRGVGVIIGGIKIETKLDLIKNFSKKAELIILVGAIANTFLKAKNFEVGKSIIDQEKINDVRQLSSNKIIIPFDFQTNKGYRHLGEIKKDEIIYDIGQESIHSFIDSLKNCQLIIWNGPLGWIENKKYSLGSKSFARALAKLKAYKIIGGGETLSVVHSLNLENKFNFISTGGGAMLYYLAFENLPIFENNIKK